MPVMISSSIYLPRGFVGDRVMRNERSMLTHFDLSERKRKCSIISPLSTTLQHFNVVMPSKPMAIF